MSFKINVTAIILGVLLLFPIIFVSIKNNGEFKLEIFGTGIQVIGLKCQ